MWAAGLVVLLALPTLAADGGTPAAPLRPVHISAPSFKVYGKENRAVYSGGVKAKRGATELSCDRLTAHYDAKGEVRRIHCVGHVEAVDGDKWARGEKATFDNVAAVLEVTGNPEARQGKNQMRGEVVRFYVGTDIIEVEKATTVFETAPVRRAVPGSRRSTP